MSILQESGVVMLLQRAVELDNLGKYKEALPCYENGLELMLKVMKDTSDESMKISLREKFEQYMGRAELLKKLLKKDNNYQSEVIQIQCDSTGHSYEQVFGRYLDERVTEVEVIDPYIRSNHQVANFVRLCELLVKSTQIKRISLTTGKELDQGAAHAQMIKLSELKESLLRRNIKLDVEYSQTLHDREIRLNNGWTIKIGRGLDYFKAAESKFSIGMYDMNLRTCHETTVNIFHVNSVAKT
ncbi:hypothetical protein HELRODRAFT_73540 [Helobdella robusta]|uniref:MIT domain-containing protein n=1 Tax=Helobdella robusta TaxID=6412 RepID=T1G1F5_HELRO|nr:hypothetical protein HELRODRAFT_73540 [Helobdella robusta]ESO09561.1 hypothetical protein HELRODRAFT_73540 [Helobdella robusta]